MLMRMPWMLGSAVASAVRVLRHALRTLAIAVAITRPTYAK
jgi:hypothetical protein